MTRVLFAFIIACVFAFVIVFVFLFLSVFSGILTNSTKRFVGVVERLGHHLFSHHVAVVHLVRKIKDRWKEKER